MYAHDNLIHSISFYNDRLVTTSTDTTVKLWDLKSDDPIDTYYDHEEKVVSSDLYGKFQITLDSDGCVLVKEEDDADITFEIE
jgi:WD40 repeat protein